MMSGIMGNTSDQAFFLLSLVSVFFPPHLGIDREGLSGGTGYMELSFHLVFYSFFGAMIPRVTTIGGRRSFQFYLPIDFFILSV